MHEHDHGLIMALAEAALGENDAAAAAAEIAGCIRCTEDLEMQRLALDATAGAPNIYLSATESARLRNGVRRELKLSPEAVKPARRRRFPVGALAGAAAVLIAVVIAAPALNLLGSDQRSGETNFDDALAPPVAESAADASPEPPAAAAAPTAAPAPQTLPVTAGAPSESAGATGAPVEALALSPALPTLRSDVDLGELKSTLVEGQGRTALTFAQSNFQAEDAADAEDPAPAAAPPGSDAAYSLTACDLEAVPDVPQSSVPEPIGFVEYEGTAAIIAAYHAESDGDVLVVVVDLATCEILDSK